MESRNIIIRKTIFNDCTYFAKWENKPEVAEYFSINSDRGYEEIVREFIERDLDDTKLQYTIILKNTNKDDEIIGRIYVSKIDKESDSLDITRIYIADPKHRGKGYGEEALRLFLEYCFINLHTERVTIDHYPGNKVANSLYTKVGFKPEGIARNACKRDGKYYDLHLMSMIRSEYYERIHGK